MKKYLYLLLFLISIFIGCSNIWSHPPIYYEVVGTKTNVTIKYRNVSSKRTQDKELSSTIVNKLPWSISTATVSQSTSIKVEQWFLSAYSESEGEMTIIISGYSNTTTNKYIEMSIPFSDWRNMNETNE